MTGVFEEFVKILFKMGLKISDFLLKNMCYLSISNLSGRHSTGVLTCCLLGRECLTDLSLLPHSRNFLLHLK